MKLYLHINLKRLLKEHDLTVSQLSRATKIPVQTLSNWLVGLEPRNISQLKKVADHLGVSIDALISDGHKSQKGPHRIDDYLEEINAGFFEVILRKIKKHGN